MLTENTRVIDSRPYDNYVRRRRISNETWEKFNTYEISEEEFKKLKDIEKTNKIIREARGLL